jgi:hypothetical protein
LTADDAALTKACERIIAHAAACRTPLSAI